MFVLQVGIGKYLDAPTWTDLRGSINDVMEMRKLLDSRGINGSRNFYALRHTFETVGGEAKDQVAVDHIMGHARDDMAKRLTRAEFR